MKGRHYRKAPCGQGLCPWGAKALQWCAVLHGPLNALSFVFEVGGALDDRAFCGVDLCCIEAAFAADLKKILETVCGKRPLSKPLPAAATHDASQILATLYLCKAACLQELLHGWGLVVAMFQQQPTAWAQPLRGLLNQGANVI